MAVSDHVVNVTCASADEVLTAGERIEIDVTAAPKWQPFLDNGWISIATDNGQVDDRPTVHPDWP